MEYLITQDLTFSSKTKNPCSSIAASIEASFQLHLKTLPNRLSCHVLCDCFQMRWTLPSTCFKHSDFVVTNGYHKGYLCDSTPRNLDLSLKLDVVDHQVDEKFVSLDCTCTVWMYSPNALHKDKYF